jgi:hypothetical protein
MTRVTSLLGIRVRVGLAVLCTVVGADAAKPKPKAAPQPKPAPTPTTPSASPSAPSGLIAVTVVETAGTRAYVQPGSSAGVRRSAIVTVRGREYPVIDASDSFAVVDMGDERLHEQDSGWVKPVAQEEQKAVELPKPRPLDTWKQAWAPEPAPSDTQEPHFVPLGEAERSRRFDVRFTLAGGGVIPLAGQVGSSLGEAELDLQLHAEPFEAPVSLDLDASLQRWVASDLATRVGASTRPAVFVRELLASYALGSFYAGIGRMRYAASTLGSLDGVRVADGIAPGLSLGAFGGLLPNPLSGAPSLDAQRFGVEARYSRPDFDLRPEAALVVHGSTFDSRLDERRVSGLLSLYPGRSRLGGYFEVSNFDADNPWKASPVELTAAGVDQSIRLGSFELGGRFDIRQPERSRWLATFLPASWFCTTVPAPGATPTSPEPCTGSVDTHASGEVDLGVTLDNFSLVVGGLTVTDLTQTSEPNMVGGFATARLLRIAKSLRLEASGNYSRSTYMNLSGGSAGPGLTFFDDALDVSGYFRLNVLKYSSDNVSLLQDGIGGTIVVLPASELLFTLQAESIAGDDARAFTTFVTATWRPRL